ncbi:MAG TPA: hypothetical protein GXX57_05380 [Firmicutes bacterium]|nr:hypothetical protein [Bacillota bacterium]
MMTRLDLDRFCTKLDNALQGQMSSQVPAELRITGWHYSVTEQEVTSIGLNENRLGGPYAAPSSQRKLTGHLHLIWSDGSHTYTNFDRGILEGDFQHWVKVWKHIAYTDPDEPDILPPQEYPEVKVYDPDIANLPVQAHFALIAQARRELQGYGIENLDGQSQSSVGQRMIRNSAGLNVSFHVTNRSFGFYADNIYGKYFGKHRLPTEAEVQHLLTTVGQTTAQLKQPTTVPITSGKMPIILMPDVTGMFLQQYIGHNLEGSRVVEGHSAFTLEAFRAKEQVFSPRLSVFIEPLRDYEYGTAPCTNEGIPSKRLAVIKEGRLQTPLLNRKYAKKANLEPTPAGPLLIPREGSLSQLIGEIDRGLLILSVLGLHSQNTTAGTYSVTADQALVIEQGRPRGKVKASIAGNLFAQLNSTDFDYGFDDYADYPGLRLLADVTIED